MTDSSAPIPINCSIRQPVDIKLDETKSEFRSGISVIEVKFPNVLRAEVGEIHFKNFYAAHVSVKMKERGGMVESVDKKWKTVIKRIQLMPHPHCETGSQDYFTIKKKQFLCELDNVIGLRFILYQPSPVWKEFRIEHIKLYKTSYQDSTVATLPSWLTSSGDDMSASDDSNKNAPSRAMVNAVIPNIDSVAQSLQQLWALAEKVKVRGNKNPLGRYDVDGSYEINLLSYT